jgi:ATP sulfurylase
MSALDYEHIFGMNHASKPMYHCIYIYVASYTWMTVNNELEIMWKEAVIAAYCKVLAQHLPTRTKENHKQLQTRELLFWPRFEASIIA